MNLLILITGYIPLFLQIYLERITVLEIIIAFFFSTVITQIISTLFIDRVYLKSQNNSSLFQTIQRIVALCFVYVLACYMLYYTVLQTSSTIDYSAYSLDAFISWLQGGFLSVLLYQSWAVGVLMIMKILYTIATVAKKSKKMNEKELMSELMKNAWIRSILPLTLVVISYASFVVALNEQTVAFLFFGTALLSELIGYYYSKKDFTQYSQYMKDLE